MCTILLVGEDAMLLQTRAAVLRKTGCEVLSCDAASAVTIQADRECKLVVLCHSLSSEVCEALAEALHMRWPKTRILLVVSQREWGYAEAKAAVDAVSSVEPSGLIERTTELLQGVDGLDMTVGGKILA